MTEHQFLIVDKPTFFRFAAAAPENMRCEYVRGRIVQQMAGGTRKHAMLAQRLVKVIDRTIDPGRWIVLGSDRAVETSETIRYPDIVVEPSAGQDNSLATKEPALVIEILSQSSEERDLDIKPLEYLSIPSLFAYIVVDQDTPRFVVWYRATDGRFPALPTIIEGTDAVVEVPELTIRIPLTEIYQGIA